MKKIFKSEQDIIRAVEEKGIFEWHDRENNKVRAVDNNGKEIEGYKRPPVELDASDAMEGNYPDDPTAIGPVSDGVYPYSTQPVEWDPDGYFGIIGFKNYDGTIIVEEQYEQVDDFFNGLCSVKKENSDWGCIDKKGNVVIDFKYAEPVRFNKYGVAVADNCLIDLDERKIEGTELNFSDVYFEDDRYFKIAFFSEEEQSLIDEYGSADGLTEDVYDTKNKAYVVKGVPDCRLNIYEFGEEPEPGVIIAAAGLLSEYEEVEVMGAKTIIAKKAGENHIFDYYL